MQLCFPCFAYFLSSVEFPHRAFCSESPSSPKMSRTIIPETLGFMHCYADGQGRWTEPAFYLTFVFKWLHSMRKYEEERRPSLCPHRGRSLLWTDCFVFGCGMQWRKAPNSASSKLPVPLIYLATELLAMLRPPFISALGPFVIWSSNRPFFPVYHSSLSKELKVQIIDFILSSSRTFWSITQV